MSDGQGPKETLEDRRVRWLSIAERHAGDAGGYMVYPGDWAALATLLRNLASPAPQERTQPADPQPDLTERARVFVDGHNLWNMTSQQLVRLFVTLAQSEREAAAAEARRAALSEFRNRMSLRLNNHLIEMKPGYDDSITGFNEAWEILIRAFDESLERLSFASPAPQEGSNNG